MPYERRKNSMHTRTYARTQNESWKRKKDWLSSWATLPFFYLKKPYTDRAKWKKNQQQQHWNPPVLLCLCIVWVPCLYAAGLDLILVFIACIVYCIIAYEHILFTINALFLYFLVFGSYCFSTILLIIELQHSLMGSGKRLRKFLRYYRFGLILLKKNGKQQRITRHTQPYINSIRHGLWSHNDFSLLGNEWIYLHATHLMVFFSLPLSLASFRFSRFSFCFCCSLLNISFTMP